MATPAAFRPQPRLGSRLPARLLRAASDDRLVELVRAGSQPAFEVAFDRHHRPLLAFCRHMLGSVDEAEDAVQHTFMSAYRSLLSNGKSIQLRPWLYAIARNRCLSMLRARRERPVDEVPEVPTEQLSAEVDRRHDLRALLGDVAGLPEEQRTALVLSEAGGVTHEEIAQVLGCPRGKVKALVFQARSSLNDSRMARETPCAEIREQLATLRGGALRRNSLRRHLRECPGCHEFKVQMQAQRRALAVILPVAPTLALKHSVLAAAFGGGGAAGGGGAVLAGGAAVTAGGAGAAGSGALVAKALVAVALAGGGAAAGVDAVRDAGRDGSPPAGRSSAAPGQAVAAQGEDPPAAEAGTRSERERGSALRPGARGLGAGATGERGRGRATGRSRNKAAQATTKAQRRTAKRERKAARTRRQAAHRTVVAQRNAARGVVGGGQAPTVRPVPKPKPRPASQPAVKAPKLSPPSLPPVSAPKPPKTTLHGPG